MSAGWIRAGTAGLLLCLLSACWLSEKPLLTARNSTEVDFAGTYRSVGEEDEGNLVIAPAGHRAYRMEAGAEQLATHYLRLGKDWYLAQYEGRDEEAGTEDDGAPEVLYFYQPMRVAGGRLYIYSPECERMAGEYPGMERASGVCSFHTLEGLRAAALTYIDAVEKGEIADRPAIWARLSVTR